MPRARVPLLAQPGLSRPYKQSKHGPVPRAGRVLGGRQTFQRAGELPARLFALYQKAFPISLHPAASVAAPGFPGVPWCTASPRTVP